MCEEAACGIGGRGGSAGAFSAPGVSWFEAALPLQARRMGFIAFGTHMYAFFHRM